jgi:hypothetical protein
MIDDLNPCCSQSDVSDEVADEIADWLTKAHAQVRREGRDVTAMFDVGDYNILQITVRADGLQTLGEWRRQQQGECH